MGLLRRPAGPATGLDWLINLGLLLATLLVFSQLRKADFINFDDQLYVTQNPQVLAGLSKEGVIWAFTTYSCSNWHPLTWMSLQLDVRLFGAGPAGFHVTNVVIHALNAVLVFMILRRMTGRRWPSALAAGLFALHPLRVESVAWVAERKELLCTFFGLLALLAYASYVERPGVLRYSAVALTFALSLLAKPMLVTLPCVLLLVDYWPLQRWPGQAEGVTWRRLVLEKVPLFVLAGTASALTVMAQQSGGATQSLEKVTLPSRIANAGLAYRDYLRQMAWPSDLAPFYEHSQPRLTDPLVLATAAGLLAFTWFVLRKRQKMPYLTVGWLWYLGTLVPVLGIVQVGLQARADRYTYVPMIGIAMALAWGCAELARRGRPTQIIVAVLAMVVLAGLAGLSWAQASYWRNSETLWRHALRVTPPSRTVLLQLSSDLALAGRFEDALPCYNQALALNAKDACMLYNRGVALMRLGRMAPAERDLREAVEADPADAQARMNLAILCSRLGNRAEARVHYEEALRLDPNLLPARANLGMELFAAGQAEAAEKQLAEAVRRHPTAAQAYTGLGMVQAWLGHYAGAEATYRESARLEPSLPMTWHQLAQVQGLEGHWQDAVDSSRAAVRLAPTSGVLRGHLAYCLQRQGDRAGDEELNQSLQLQPDWPIHVGKTAWKWATQPDSGQRNGALAVYLGEWCCQSTGNVQPELLDVLAAAYAEHGEFERAAVVARKALEQAGTSPDLAATIGSRLRLYEKRQAFREAAR